MAGCRHRHGRRPESGGDFRFRRRAHRCGDHAPDRCIAGSARSVTGAGDCHCYRFRHPAGGHCGRCGNHPRLRAHHPRRSAAGQNPAVRRSRSSGRCKLDANPAAPHPAERLGPGGGVGHAGLRRGDSGHCRAEFSGFRRRATGRRVGHADCQRSSFSDDCTLGVAVAGAVRGRRGVQLQPHRPHAGGDSTMNDTAQLIDIRHLSVAYRFDGQINQAVRNVSFQVARGETVAIVGESGSGKSTMANAILGLLPDNAAITGGELHVDGHDLGHAGEREKRRIRGGTIGLVPQDPMVSLNPTLRIGRQIAEALLLAHGRRYPAVDADVLELLQQVGLDKPVLRARQYPHELSGGMR
ncbi:ABC transporter, partial [Pseudomonas syringae pv. solidagae]